MKERIRIIYQKRCPNKNYYGFCEGYFYPEINAGQAYCPSCKNRNKDFKKLKIN